MGQLLNFLAKLFSTDFVPQGYCMRWQSDVLWLHVVSDSVTALAYLFIPVILWLFGRKRNDIPFHRIFLAFGAFILACSAGHVMSIVTLWKPLYRLDGLMKAVTAVASAITAICLFRLLPVLLKLSGMAELQRANKALQQEVAERQEVERKLRISQAERCERELQFLRTVDFMPQLAWVTGPDGRVQWFNARWREYTGTGLAKDESSDDWNGCFHPEDAPETMSAWKRSVETGEPFEIEHRCRRHDGVYRWFLARAMPLWDSDRLLVRWFGACTDIDDQKQAQAHANNLNDTLEERVRRRTAALAEATQESVASKARLRRVLDAATGLAVIATTADGIIEIFNSGAERMLQYSAGEMEGVHSTDILQDPAKLFEAASALSRELGKPPGEIDVVAHYARCGRQEEHDWALVRKDGRRVEVSLTVTAIEGSDGVPQGSLLVAVDTTVRKSLERDLQLYNEKLRKETCRAEESNQAKSAFLSAMSHEIRTPMNAILGMADILWETQLDSEQAGYVEVFRRSGSNLLTLINDILDVSKLEAGVLELEHIPFEIHETVYQAVELIGVKAHAKELLLLWKLSPDLPRHLVGDPNRLRQILINLLGNAVKFTSSGEVSLTVQNADSGAPGEIEFIVSDTGIGIRPEQMERIFDDFTQGDSSITRTHGGSGLGLAISRRLVTRLGGQLKASSVETQGSTFRFTAKFELPSRPGLVPSELEDLHGRRVLIIDPSTTSRLILRETVTSWGMENTAFETIDEALAGLAEAMAGANPYSLVFLDSSLPAVNSFESAAGIRRIAPNLPIVMLASGTKPGDAKRGREACLAGFGVKPITRAELLQLVCEALRWRTETVLPHVESAASKAKLAPISLKILIAEDMVDNRQLMQAYLKGSPHRLTFVENGQAAVDCFGAGAFDLILMDWQMPVMDGLTATRLIRTLEQERGIPSVPIVALTANARSQHIEMSREAGCNSHVTKPISKQRLFDVIGKYGGSSSPAAALPKASAKSILITMPPDVADIVPAYLESRKLEFPEMLKLLAASDFDRLAFLGHNMKGTGGAYGFSELSNLGAAVETSAKQQNPEVLGSLLIKLEDYLGKVQLLPIG